MKEKIQKILTHKGFYMIISIIGSILVWLFVLNYSNPIITRTLEVPLVYLHQEVPPTFDLIDSTSKSLYPDTLTVIVKGRQDIINNLVSSEMYSSIDFSNINTAGKTVLKISEPYSSRMGVSVENFYPKEIECTFDTTTEKYLNVNVDYDESILKAGYKIVNIEVEPASLPISGLASLVDELEYVKVNLADTFSEGQLDGSKKVSLICRYIDKSNNDITHKFDTERIDVQIEVAKEVPLDYSLTGSPANDYYMGNVTFSTSKLLLTGTTDVLNKVTSIYIGDIDISNSKSKVSKNFTLPALPEGTTLYGDPVTNVTINVNILPYLTKELTVSLDNLNKYGMQSDLYSYDITPVTRQITVRGTAEQLQLLTDSTTLAPTINLENMTIGEYHVVLSIGNTDVTLVGQYVYRIVVSEKKTG